jgi:hypothetical protein
MKPVVRVIITSGIPEPAETSAFAVEQRTATTITSTAIMSDVGRSASCIKRAAMTFDSAMTDPSERSIPPATTTHIWARAANARGNATRASDSRSKGPKAG